MAGKVYLLEDSKEMGEHERLNERARRQYLCDSMTRREGKIGILFPSSANGLLKSAMGKRLTLKVPRSRKVR